jgi:hypothetical protein
MFIVAMAGLLVLNIVCLAKFANLAAVIVAT